MELACFSRGQTSRGWGCTKAPFLTAPASVSALLPGGDGQGCWTIEAGRGSATKSSEGVLPGSFQGVRLMPDPITEESEKRLGSTEDSLKNTLGSKLFRVQLGTLEKGDLPRFSEQPG